MDWQNYIVSDKEVLLGKPTIKGTRISVEHIVGLLAQGWTENEILENFPRLTKESLQLPRTSVRGFDVKELGFSPMMTEEYWAKAPSYLIAF
jgi:uncharacterized protein (DUF433 family)